MSYYWVIDGTIEPKKDKIEQVAAVLRNKYGLGCPRGAEEGTFRICESRYGGGAYGYYLAHALSPLLDEGEIEATNDNNRSHMRCIFQNGKYRILDGFDFVYYPGYEEDFVNQLPDEIVDFITRKALKKEKGEKV